MSLLTALRSKDERLVETICVSGANPNELEDGATAMHIAVGMKPNKDFHLTKILLEYGGDPNVEDDEKVTPVHISVIWGKEKILKLLLKHGGDPTRKDEDGRDAWDFALKYGRQGCQKVLQEYLDTDEKLSVASTDATDANYISIFCADAPQYAGSYSRLSTCSSSNDLDRGFLSTSRTSSAACSPIGSSTSSKEASPDNLPSIREESDLVVLLRTSPPKEDATPTPQPPPRRSKSIKSLSRQQHVSPTTPTMHHYSPGTNSTTVEDVVDCAACRYGRSMSVNIAHPATHHIRQVRTAAAAPQLKRSRSSPGGMKVRFTPPNSGSSSPSDNNKSKSKKSPFAKITSSPSKAWSKLKAKISPHHHKSDKKLGTPIISPPTPQSSTVRRRLISDRDKQLLVSRPQAIDATSPDNCVIIFSSPQHNKALSSSTAADKCSPSNLGKFTPKPDQEKKLESPFRKLKSQSGKTLFGRANSVPSPQKNQNMVVLRPNQTLELSKSAEADIVSQISLPTTNASPPAAIPSGKSTQSACLCSRDVMDIVEGKKCLDATSPDHCLVVDVTSNPGCSSALEKTICLQQGDSDAEVFDDTSRRPSLTKSEGTQTTRSPQQARHINLPETPPPTATSCSSSNPSIHEPVTTRNSCSSSTHSAPKKPPRTHEYDAAQRPAVSSAALMKQQKSTLNHRWSSKAADKSQPGRSATVDIHQQLTLCIDNDDDYLGSYAQPCKDSGFSSSPSETVRKRLQTECSNADSEESFHTCNSAAAVKSAAATSAALPTEEECLLAKVSRMNLEDFTHEPEEDDQECDDEDLEAPGSPCYSFMQRPSLVTSTGDKTISEYLYTDTESNITIMESRLPTYTTETNSLPDLNASIKSHKSLNWKTQRRLSNFTTLAESSCGESEAPVERFVIPDDISSLSDEELIKQLIEAGDTPGPLNDCTRRVFQIRLTKLRELTQGEEAPVATEKLCYSIELHHYMASSPTISLVEISQWESEMVSQFDARSEKKWREGNSKMSFNYLLLDPRTTKNLPSRLHLLNSDASAASEAFKIFLSSIFYIGKGKKTRPYQHFIEAIRRKNSSEKTKQILDIWKSGQGVVSLHVFHNTIPVEAFTREACMVEAIGLDNLTNKAKCNFYGIASAWNKRKKKLVGASLLYKAFSILLIEGERQIKPLDVREELPSFLTTAS